VFGSFPNRLMVIPNETTQLWCLATLNQPGFYNNRLLLWKRVWFKSCQALKLSSLFVIILLNISATKTV